MRKKVPTGKLVEVAGRRVHPITDRRVRDICAQYERKLHKDVERLLPIKHYFRDYSHSIIPVHR